MSNGQRLTGVRGGGVAYQAAMRALEDASVPTMQAGRQVDPKALAGKLLKVPVGVAVILSSAYQHAKVSGPGADSIRGPTSTYGGRVALTGLRPGDELTVQAEGAVPLWMQVVG